MSRPPEPPERPAVALDPATAGSGVSVHPPAVSSCNATSSEVEDLPHSPRVEPGGEPETEAIQRACSDLRWYAKRLCVDKPERYEVWQTRDGEETTLSDACSIVLAHVTALDSRLATAEQRLADAELTARYQSDLARQAIACMKETEARHGGGNGFMRAHRSAMDRIALTAVVVVMAGAVVWGLRLTAAPWYWYVLPGLFVAKWTLLLVLDEQATEGRPERPAVDPDRSWSTPLSSSAVSTCPTAALRAPDEP